MGDSLEPQRGDVPAFLIELEHRQRCVQLKAKGMSYQAIADHLANAYGHVVTWESVRDVVRRALRSMVNEHSETVQELRQLEDERLDSLLRTFGPQAREGDVKAGRLVLGVSKRRADMHGLDAAQRIEHTHKGSILHELGADPEEIARERAAFETAFTRPGLPDPAEAIVDAEFEDLPEDVPDGE